jgi:hypothetical protein
MFMFMCDFAMLTYFKLQLSGHGHGHGHGHRNGDMIIDTDTGTDMDKDKLNGHFAKTLRTLQVLRFHE